MNQLFALIAVTLLASFANAESLQLTLPPMWYAVPEVPMSLYFDNVVLTEHPENYRFEVKCDVGATEEKRWTLTPTDSQVGDHAMSVIVKDAQGRVIEEAKTLLRIAPKTSGQNNRHPQKKIPPIDH